MELAGRIATVRGFFPLLSEVIDFGATADGEPVLTRGEHTGSRNWTDSAVNRDEVVLAIKAERTIKLYARYVYHRWRYG